MDFYIDSELSDKPEIIKRKFIKKLGGSCFDENKLLVVYEFFESPHSDQFRPILLKKIVGSNIILEPLPIKDFLADDDFTSIIAIYVNEILLVSEYLSTPSMPVKFQSIVNHVVYYEMGRWAVRNLKISNQRHQVEKLKICGEQYQNFVSQMIAFQCMNKTERKCFVRFRQKYLGDNYHQFLDFVKKDRDTSNDMNRIIALMKKARRYSQKITKEWIAKNF